MPTRSRCWSACCSTSRRLYNGNAKRQSQLRCLVGAPVSVVQGPQKVSHIAQQETGAKWVAEHGHTVVGTFQDLGVSASVSPFDRPDLGPWLTREKSYEWDVLVFSKLDRLFRSNRDCVKFAEWAEQHQKVPRRSHSPICTPARMRMQRVASAGTKSNAHRVAFVGPSNSAKMPPPVCLARRPPYFDSVRSTSWSCMSSRCRHRESTSLLSCSVEPTMSVNHTVASTRSLVGRFSGPQRKLRVSGASESSISRAP